MTAVYLAGSGSFGAAVADAIAGEGHKIVGVTAPREGRRGRADHLHLWAERGGLPLSETLRPDLVPDGTDLLFTAHSHAFVGRLTRARARYALGYHPSLLPLHRGRDAVRWQARLGERVVGGTIYHLTDRVDGGPIADQRHLIVPPGLDASRLWRDHLFPLGVEMAVRAADDCLTVQGPAVRPQDDRLATWEPAFDSEPLYRPELLELEAPR